MAWNNKEMTERLNHIPDNSLGNKSIEAFYESVKPRKQRMASPSSLTTCPRAQWLVNHDVPETNPMGWGIRHRLERGREIENDLALKLAMSGDLLIHFRDNPTNPDAYPVTVDNNWVVKQGDATYKSVEPMDGKFQLKYKGTPIMEGIPDYLLVDANGRVTTSDCKTSRSDSFAYIPFDNTIWDDYGWFKYKLQVTAYAMMINQSGFLKSKYFDTWPVGSLDELSKLGNLMSYAMDDGIIKRDITWVPTEEDMRKIIAYALRLNAGINSEVMPPCTCGDTPKGEWDGIPFATKFCPFATINDNTYTTKTGKTFYRECCDRSLGELA